MKTNSIGLDKKTYQGSPSTLCTGCGHDSITNHIVTALYETNTPPHKIAKISGIGCSSKTTNYFAQSAHGFNAIHGRMAAVATGAKVSNLDLNVIGISGDGDSASIGLGGFVHLLRRNLPMVYIVENNGVYGLTKGQFSATADEGSLNKKGASNYFDNIDLCSLAINSGCSFVARAFSGDRKQVVALISAALHHNGTAFLDIVSPCVAFANNEGSTKSFQYVKSTKQSLQEFGFVSDEKEISAEVSEDQAQLIRLHNGNYISLKKIDEKAYDPENYLDACKQLKEDQNKKIISTGLIYFQKDKKSFIDTKNLPAQPLVSISQEKRQPSKEILNKIQQDFK